jgi:hypothetical protein
MMTLCAKTGSPFVFCFVFVYYFLYFYYKMVKKNIKDFYINNFYIISKHFLHYLHVIHMQTYT